MKARSTLSGAVWGLFAGLAINLAVLVMPPLLQGNDYTEIGDAAIVMGVPILIVAICVGMLLGSRSGSDE